MNTTPDKTNESDPVIPRRRATQVLVAAADLTDKQYLAFPAVHRINDHEVLISFKRGYAHGADREADLEMILFDTVENRVVEQRTIGHIDNVVLQMGEWVEFPDGSLGNYNDAQITGVKKANYRTGMCRCVSTDGGQSFGPMEQIGVVDGIEYGYPLESRIVDGVVYLLAMTFEFLAGRKGTVDVISSDDNGGSWKFVRDLSKEFGYPPINETTFVECDDGFLVSTRGYDSRQRIHRVNRDFELIAEADLTAACSYIDRQIGRPRIFEKDGCYYLMGRNYTSGADDAVMKRCMFRIDKEKLSIESWTILDNYEEARVIDGYYPVCYWQERDGREYFNIIDYKSVLNRYPGPDIVRHEYEWDEVR